MKQLTGIPGSGGYALGAAVVKAETALEVPRAAISSPEDEIVRFRLAQTAYCERLDELFRQTERELGTETAEIFSAYSLIVRDEAFFKKVFRRVERERVNIEYIIENEREMVAAVFAAMDDPYMRDRAADIENVCNELIRLLMGQTADYAAKINGRSNIIAVADDLTPSETIKIDKSALCGIATERGGPTSHMVILAKVLGIPAIVGATGLLDHVADGDELLVDAYEGLITINPDKSTRAAFLQTKSQCDRDRARYLAVESKPAVTRDGFTVDVNISSGDPDSLNAFDPSRCDGIGLLRTEFFYISRPDYPTEAEQFALYRQIAEKSAGKEVVIRTLDIGGGKQASYMNLPKEENPCLGYRAIRLCLSRPGLFRTQLRAILRASAFGNIKIIFPLIVCLEELCAAKQIVEEEKAKLRQDGIAFNEDIAIGIMVETPAAALLSDVLAKESAFFWIGTNDLIQYTTATDRTNKNVQNLYDSCNLSVLRSVAAVAKNAADAGIPWGICGESASEERLIPLWVALGVRKLSVAPSQVGAVKHLIGRLNRSALIPPCNEILTLHTIASAKAALDTLLQSCGQ